MALLLSVGANASEPFTVRRWTVEDGLPQQSITCLAQTPDGYLWCGTWFGLARFDGLRFTTFNRNNTPALQEDDTITALTADSRGRLWIGLKRGLAVLENNRIHKWDLPAEFGQARFASLAPAKDGGIWAGTSRGLLRLGNGTNRFCGFPHSPHDPSEAAEIRGLQELPSGRVITLIAWGLRELDPESGRFHVLGPQINASAASRFAVQGATISLAHRDGLDQVDVNGVRRIWTSGDSSGDLVTALLSQRGGALIFTTSDGRLHRHLDGRIETVSLAETQAFVGSAMLEDTEGNLCVGTDGGLNVLRPAALQTVTVRDGLPGNTVWSIAPSGSGGVWVATDRGCARICDDFSVEPQSSPPANCTTILEDRLGRVWVGQPGGGLEWWEGWVWRHATELFNARVQEPHAIYEDRAGELWLGTSSGVGRYFRNDWFEWWCATNGLPPGAVRVIHQDREGAMWFGVNGAGLVRKRHGRLEVFDRRHGFEDLRPTVIHETEDGVLWVGTENGLHRFTEGRATALNTRHGLAESLVNCILEDELGHFWLSGLTGIHCVRRSELEAVADGGGSRVRCATFGSADGLSIPETNGENQPAGCRTPDGRLWFPTVHGVAIIRPQQVMLNETPPRPRIESVAEDGEAVMGDGIPFTASEMKFRPRRSRVLRIAYTAPLLRDGRHVRFRSRLRGLSEDWHEAGDERVVYFNDLRPRSYCFEVMAAGPHGEWSATRATFSFSIAPSFVQTPWFPASCGAGLLLLGGALGAVRVRWQTRALRAEHAAAMAEERTRIADDLHDELGAGLAEIGVLAELAHVQGNQPGPTHNPISQIRQSTLELSEAVDEIVWSLNPRQDSTDKFASYLQGYAQRILEPARISCLWDQPTVTPALPMRAGIRHELFLITKEALHNVVKHARATEVRVIVQMGPDSMRILIRDNGAGFDPATATEAGNGLASMRRRVARVYGTISLKTSPNEGTAILVDVPLQTTERTSA